MKPKADAIGMTTSNFVNSDGYDDEDKYTTPRDLVLLGRRT
jgi:D-alanyl-D-alanine carboxypeptidase